MSTCCTNEVDQLHSPGDEPSDGEPSIVLDVAQDEAHDHVKALSELDPIAGSERRDHVRDLSRAFHAARIALGASDAPPSLSIELDTPEVLTLAAGHGARATVHRRKGHDGAARVGESHAEKLLLAAATETPQRIVENIHE